MQMEAGIHSTLMAAMDGDLSLMEPCIVRGADTSLKLLIMLQNLLPQSKVLKLLPRSYMLNLHSQRVTQKLALSLIHNSYLVMPMDHTNAKRSILQLYMWSFESYIKRLTLPPVGFADTQETLIMKPVIN